MLLTIDNFVNYLKLTLISKNVKCGWPERKALLFPIQNWNKICNEKNLTNNFSESWNHGWTHSLEQRPNLFNSIEAFHQESWGHHLMRDSFLFAGVDHKKNKERTETRVARRKDLAKFCSNIENMNL